MNSNQLQQPLNPPSSFQNQNSEFSLGKNQAPSNIKPPNNLNMQGNMNKPGLPPTTIPPPLQTGKSANQLVTQQMQMQNISNAPPQNNRNTQATSEKNCTLIVMYMLIGIISIAGFIVAIMLIAKYSDGIESFAKYGGSFSIDFNFIMIYIPMSIIVFFFAMSLIYYSCSNNGRDICWSQYLCLFFGMCAFVFGIVNYAQFPSMTCSGLNDTDYCRIYVAFKNMELPVSIIPFVLLLGTQYLIYRLKQAPPQPQNANPQTNNVTRDLELQQKNDPKLNTVNNQMKPPQIDQKNNLGGIPPLGGLGGVQPPNGNLPSGIDQVGMKGGLNGLQNNKLPNIQTDPKLTQELRVNTRGSQISDKNGMFNNINQQNANILNGNTDIGFQNPVQKFNNQGPANGRSGSIVNNFGVPMYGQQPPKQNQFQLDDKEISTPPESGIQIGFNGQLNPPGNLGFSQNMSTPTPNMGMNSKLNQNPFENSPDIHNMKTTTSQFTNSPMKSPIKAVSPIDKALSHNLQQVQFDNTPENVNNNDYNPFGNTQNGEIQIGKHPYIIGAKDPYIGQILDQVHIMVNSQVQSLLLNLKKQNKY